MTSCLMQQSQFQGRAAGMGDGAGGLVTPKILTYQLTQGVQNMPITLLRAPPGFSDLSTPLQGMRTMHSALAFLAPFLYNFLYRVFHSKHLYFNLLWRIEICKLDLV